MREVLYPLTDLATVLALIVFLLPVLLVEAVRPFGFWLALVLGFWLALIIVPAYFRYLLYLLEARANGRDAPPPGIELFNWVENFWSLFPLVLICLLIWGTWFLATDLSPAAAWVFGVFILLVYPASMAVLAVTHLPLESLNPAALAVLIRNCGHDYLLIPLSIVAMAFLTWYLVILQVPALLTKAVGMYATFLMFTMTGGIVHANAAGIKVDMPPAREPDAEELEAELTLERTKVLNHAYGFISRGNRQAGLQHLYDWIEKETDAAAAYRWFFEEMLKWESKEAALFFAEKYLSWLLGRRRDVEALKLIARCRLEDARFMPLPEDRGKALSAAESQHNDELCEYLRR